MPEATVKPYLLRALFEWCNDNGLTPYLTVQAGEGVEVPREHVRDGEIVLNISPLATNRLLIGNDEVTFQARFGGVAREVRVPISAVLSIYARENGQGMAFEPAARSEGQEGASGNAAPAVEGAPTRPGAGPHRDAPAGVHAVVQPAAGSPATPLRAVPAELVPARPRVVPRDPGDPHPPGPAGGGDRPRLTRVK
jgi:stringent starvation protein B